MRVLSIDVGYRNLSVCAARWCPERRHLKFVGAYVGDALDGRKPRSHAITCFKVLQRLDSLLVERWGGFKPEHVVIERQHRGVNVPIAHALQGYFFPIEVSFLPPKHKFLAPAHLGLECPSGDLKRAATECLEGLIFASPQNLCLDPVKDCFSERRREKRKVDDIADSCIQLLSYLQASHGILLDRPAGHQEGTAEHPSGL